MKTQLAGFLGVIAALVISESGIADDGCVQKMQRLSKKVPPSLLFDLFTKLKANHLKLTRPVIVVDFSRRSTEERFFVIDLQAGTAEGHITTHGLKSASKSDPTKATRFSDDLGSGESTLGLFRIGKSQHSPGLGRDVSHLEGLEAATQNAGKRVVCVQENDDVSDAQHTAGMTHGCFGIDPVYYGKKKDEFNGAILMSGLDRKSDDRLYRDGRLLCEASRGLEATPSRSHPKPPAGAGQKSGPKVDGGRTSVAPDDSQSGEP